MSRGIERLLVGHVWAVYGFLYAPLVVMGLFSLNSAEFMAFPLEEFTFRWYREVVADERLLGGFLTTLSIAVPVTMVTTVVGAMAALALTRFTFRLKWLLLLLLTVPFFVPKIVFAVGQVVYLDLIDMPKGTPDGLDCPVARHPALHDDHHRLGAVSHRSATRRGRRRSRCHELGDVPVRHPAADDERHPGRSLHLLRAFLRRVHRLVLHERPNAAAFNPGGPRTSASISPPS